MTRVLWKTTTLVILTATLLAPQPAEAQQPDGWKVDFIPLYFWATSLGGNLTAVQSTVPIDLDFSKAKDHLGGAFSFHLEASKGRWGVLADLNFIRLVSDADFAVGAQTVAGDFELDNVVFELGASYLAADRAQLRVIGGLRTYTLSPNLAFSALGTSITPVDATQTSANAFVGLTLRPKLSDKWTLISRADIGAGNADLTWSAEAGLGYAVKPWMGLAFGYKGLGIDVEREREVITKYDVTHQGPFFALSFHWGR